MDELFLNKFNIQINNPPKKLYFLNENDLEEYEKHFLAKYNSINILKWTFLNNETKNFINNYGGNSIKNGESIYISFINHQNAKEIDIEFQTLPFSLQKKFLKEIFIRFLSNYYIIEPYKKGVDFSVYKKNDTDDNQYTTFNFVFNIYKGGSNKLFYDVIIGIENTNSYILKIPVKKFNLTQNYRLKFVDRNFLIENKELGIDVLNNPIKANFEIKRFICKTNKLNKKFYRDYYNIIKEFIIEVAKIISNEWFILNTSFSRIPIIQSVSFESNKMVFGGDNIDFIAKNGIRNHGPYLIPDEIKKMQILFIYPDKISFNKLHSYFARGYRHFSGLESYVGIPVNSFEEGIDYESDKINLLPERINNKLTQKNYSNIIAICIIPFSKLTATDEQKNIYYQIKKELLIKNISSQFIHRDKIFEENFHFYLPNIAIAMLSKCGGILWKLDKTLHNQLTIGFNIKYNKIDGTYLSSAVFFDNEGIIKEINGYKGEDLNTICSSLKQSIDKYKKDNKEILNKVVIHFHKNLSNKEISKIEEIIKDNLSKDSVFAIIEINDIKATAEIGFDLSYGSYIPQSGTYIKLKSNEYLLFNNLRYWEKPINPVNQGELPIKLRIYDPFNSFDHHELISQVYEFCRLYWGDLKQKSRPITITYSKLITEFMCGFGGELPNSEVAKKRLWFI